ncbi:MAG: two-component regulator propeller domain-containing protein [Bacteroidota bacterium]
MMRYHAFIPCPFLWLSVGAALLLLLRSAPLSGQNFGYKSITTEQGLSQNSVSALQIDHRGYMWIGTQDGLNRFDGKQLIKYRFKAANRGIHNIAIYDLEMGPGGDLYILGNYGIERLWLEKDTSMLLHCLPPEHHFRRLWIDPASGEVLVKSINVPGFIAPARASTVDPSGNYLTLMYDEEQDLIYNSYADSSRLWVGNLRGEQYYNIDNTRLPVVQDIFAILEDKKLLCKIWDGEKEKIAIARSTASGIEIEQEEAYASILQAVVQTDQNRICLIDLSGNLYLLGENLQLIKKIKAYDQNSEVLPPLFLTEALIHQDYIWLGVDPFGLLYRSLGEDQFSVFEIPQQPPAIIKNLFTDSQGRLYAFVLNRGLEAFSPEGDLITDQLRLPTPLRSKDIFAGFNGLEALGEDQFVLSGRAIFGKLDCRSMRWTDYYQDLQSQLPAADFTDLYLFYEHRAAAAPLVAVGPCYYEFDLQGRRLRQLGCFPSPITRLLAEQQQLWVGTVTGLFRCQAGQCQPDPRFEGLMIKDIRRDEQRGLLVATSIGLYFAEDSLGLINQERGLRNNYVYGSLSDDQGFVWASTNQGLSRIDPRSGGVRNYSKEDGLSATEFNSYGFWKATDGRLYFSGIGGITVVDPKAEERIQDRIPLIISALSINDRLPQQLSNPDTLLRLSSNQNTLTFHFGDLLLPQSSPLLYRYQLEGYDQHWVETDQLAARYPQLPPGEYRFRLGLANQPMMQEQVLQLLIVPPFYQRGWFILFLLLLCSLIIVVSWWLYRRWQQQRLLQRQQQQAELEAERQRISRELHDNMGAHTTALISNIQQLQAAELSTAQQQQLGRMQKDAEDILASLRDTIWVLNKRKMYLTELIDGVKMFALRLIGDQGRYNLIVNEDIGEDVLLEAPGVVHIKAILQEIIHNTIKHAGGDCIVFNIKSTPQLEFQLMDNGQGFDPDQVSGGNGLQNVYWRAQKIGAILQCESGAAGTAYRLMLTK